MIKRGDTVRIKHWGPEALGKVIGIQGKTLAIDPSAIDGWEDGAIFYANIDEVEKIEQKCDWCERAGIQRSINGKKGPVLCNMCYIEFLGGDEF